MRACLPLLALAGALAAASSHAATIAVNSLANDVADDAQCTLHEAIIAANADTASGAMAGECAAGSGADVIEFAEAGTIQPAGALPTIATRIHLNGYTAPGASVNGQPFPAGTNAVLRVEIDGVNAGDVPTFYLLGDGAAGTIIEGVAINNSGNAQCCATSAIG
jgi:hypothetical protein